MSMETIVVYRDFPIIDDKVQLENQTEMTEEDALIDNDGSVIVDFPSIAYKSRQKFLRLSGTIQGNQD